MNWLITSKNNNNDSLRHSCVYAHFFFTLLISTRVLANRGGRGVRLAVRPVHLQHASRFLPSVELSQASGGVGSPVLAEPQPQGRCLWYTGNATDCFLGKKKKKERKKFSISPRSVVQGHPESYRQLSATRYSSDRKVLCVLYGWRCIFFCYSVRCVLSFVLR